MSAPDSRSELPLGVPAHSGEGAPSGITVSVNGSAYAVPAGSTVAQLVQRLGHEPQHVATAVNGDFVARAMRAAHVLNDGDRIHCFQPIGGG